MAYVIMTADYRYAASLQEQRALMNLERWAVQVDDRDGGTIRRGRRGGDPIRHVQVRLPSTPDRSPEVFRESICQIRVLPPTSGPPNPDRGRWYVDELITAPGMWVPSRGRRPEPRMPAFPPLATGSPLPPPPPSGSP